MPSYEELLEVTHPESMIVDCSTIMFIQMPDTTNLATLIFPVESFFSLPGHTVIGILTTSPHVLPDLMRVHVHVQLDAQ